MTVRELIEKLKDHNPNALVLLPAVSRPNETIYYYDVEVSTWSKETRDNFVIVRDRRSVGVNAELLDDGWIKSKS